MEQNRINELVLCPVVKNHYPHEANADYRSICYKLLLLCGGIMQALEILFGSWGDGIVRKSDQEDLSLNPERMLQKSWMWQCTCNFSARETKTEESPRLT